MKIAAFAVLMLVLSACAPGVYVIEWNTPAERAPRERVTERVIEVEAPVPAPEPEPEPEPPVTIPREPVTPPPFAPEPPAPPAPPPSAQECSVKIMPEKSPWLQKIKCPGEPARLVPRP